jgi:molybdenum cofactor cytidylyltransferase
MPFIASCSPQVVASCLRTGASLAVSRYQGRQGHPVGFPREWFPQLAAMTGDIGGKTLLNTHQQNLVLCTVDDPGVLWDIDTKKDLEGNTGTR